MVFSSVLFIATQDPLQLAPLWFEFLITGLPSEWVGTPCVTGSFGSWFIPCRQNSHPSDVFSCIFPNGSMALLTFHHCQYHWEIAKWRYDSTFWGCSEVVGTSLPTCAVQREAPVVPIWGQGHPFKNRQLWLWGFETHSLWKTYGLQRRQFGEWGAGTGVVGWKSYKIGLWWSLYNYKCNKFIE